MEIWESWTGELSTGTLRSVNIRYGAVLMGTTRNKRLVRESKRDCDTATSPSLPTDVLKLLEKLLENQPINVDRRAGAALIRKHLFPVSHRTLESWPLPTQRVNGKAIVSTRTLLEVAYAKLASAPITMSRRRTFNTSSPDPPPDADIEMAEPIGGVNRLISSQTKLL